MHCNLCSLYVTYHLQLVRYRHKIMKLLIICSIYRLQVVVPFFFNLPLLAQFSLYVHKGGLNPIHLILLHFLTIPSQQINQNTPTWLNFHKMEYVSRFCCRVNNNSLVSRSYNIHRKKLDKGDVFNKNIMHIMHNPMHSCIYRLHILYVKVFLFFLHLVGIPCKATRQ